MAGRSVEQLEADYGDAAWRSKFSECCALIDILADCIIANNYTVSDALNDALKLSAAGTNMVNRLTMKEKVKAKDARMLCALAIGHGDLFIDIEAIDIDKLASAVDASLKKRLIRFPFIWGRQLYDAYGELFEGEKDLLTNEETLRLLEIIPEGVFQYGPFTVGPYGLRRSLDARRISAPRRVPAFHCARNTCHIVHTVSLQTGYSAAIHRDREKLDTILQATQDDASEWFDFAATLAGRPRAFYGDQRAGVLLPLIGDTIADSELRKIVAYLFDGTQGKLRKAVARFLAVGDSEQTSAKLTRAEMLQIILIAEEDSVSDAIDELVRSGEIHVPLGDIRRPVINNRARTGAFRLHAELGHYGTRFVSDDPGLALLRERHLLSKLYLRVLGTDNQELEWQLRGIDVEDLDEKLELFLHTTSPTKALERLVLARKTNMITACHEVGINHGDEMTDEQLIETLLWKLGFPTDTGDDPHIQFWQRHERLWALTQSSTIGSSDRFLETAGPYFTHLEGLLLDSLAFTSWALLVDHSEKPAPFTYDDHLDRAEGLRLLQLGWNDHIRGDDSIADFTGERIELSKLMEAFRVLAKMLKKHLELHRETPNTYERAASQLPEYDGKTDLKRFLFRTTLPFLDVSRPSQERIIDGLEYISKVLTEAELNHVRNDYAHYRRTAPDITRVEKALEATRQSVTKIENLGFCRLLFSPSTVTTDRWGQSLHEFFGPRSYEHVFTRPTPHDWMELPSLSEPQYLLRAASFGDPNEVLRFAPRFKSEFSRMWEGYPNRRRRGPGTTLTAEDEPAHQSDVEFSSGGN